MKCLVRSVGVSSDRDRHRADRQGGAHQGARRGEGGHPAATAAPHLLRQTDVSEGTVAAYVCSRLLFFSWSTNTGNRSSRTSFTS